MLSNLKVENYALIEQLNFTPSTGLTTITGETGAGKSILLGAVSLLLGKRADIKQLGNKDKKCIIEGEFDIASFNLKSIFEESDLDYEQQTLIRREILPSGKSRAFINDTPATLEVVRKIGSALMDVHSQHQTLTLGSESFQINAIDAFCENAAVLEKYKSQYKQWNLLKAEHKNLTEKNNQLKSTADFNNFQLEELQKAQLVPEEKETLEKELAVLENAEEIKSSLHKCTYLLSDGESPVVDALKDIENTLNSLQKFNSSFAALMERVKSSAIELNDIYAELQDADAEIEVDFDKTEWNRERLNTIYRLEQKHQVDGVAALIEIRDNLAQEIERSANFEEDIQSLAKEIAKKEKELSQTADKLSKQRHAGKNGFKMQVDATLQKLGIAEANFEIKISNSTLGPLGIDVIRFLFSANKGIAPEPLKKVASGGELSRVMFAIKLLLAGKMALPTLIFDEIDTGVSGEIALKLGDLMQKMASDHQIITITHLPQVAAKGKDHYFVYKDNTGAITRTNIKKLNQEERIQEIAQMISGASPSEAAFNSAQELIQNA